MPGIYVHIPFCLRKCNYCNFYSTEFTQFRNSKYLNDLNTEIQICNQKYNWDKLNFRTLYFGGGTPSLLSIRQLADLWAAFEKNCSFVSDPEITLEVNPETVDFQKLSEFKRIGINRLNIGIQSFDARELQVLQRIHDEHQAIRCLQAARKAGFQNIGLDLIFAIPGQSLPQWEANLNHAITFQPEHISTYGLTVESGTPLAALAAAGQVKFCEETIEREMYLRTIEILNAAGYEHYEISNFARPGFRSQHNQIYWRNENYWGLGASAHSFFETTRWWNVADIERYHALLKAGKLPIEESEKLTRKQQMFEWILLGLRRREGLSIMNFEEQFSVDFWEEYVQVLKKLNASLGHQEKNSPEKLIYFEDNYLKLTDNGRLVYNEICAHFA